MKIFPITLMRFLILTLAVTLPFTPMHAQTENDNTVPADEPAPSSEPVTSEEDNVPPESVVLLPSEDTQPAAPITIFTETADPNESVGGTEDAQDTIGGDTLVDTGNPSDIPIVDSDTSPIGESDGPLDATDLPIVDDTATTTDSVIPLPDETTVPDQEAVAEVPLEEDIAIIPAVELRPKNLYKFGIGAARIGTHRGLSWQADPGQRGKFGKLAGKQLGETITTAPQVRIDATEEVPVVRGSCSDAYFVILLYKNQDDYDVSPSSYILNKAYACVNGRYTFKISELPATLASGTYYLLVGSQGETGTWAPASSLVPITLTR